MNTPNPKHDVIALLALGLVDLRAQYEAELRTLNKAEAALLKCRDAAPHAYAESVEHVRAEMRPLTDIHEFVRDILRRVAADIARLNIAPRER